MRGLPLDPVESAKLASCRYVDDRTPGIARRRAGKGFRYLRPGGGKVRDSATLSRIRALAIPPAWSNVWICASEDGHIQATGRDARGRKQYRYHPRFREIREETKFERMLAFAAVLPDIRAVVDEHLGLPTLSVEKVLATVVRLLEITLIRVGNEEYARANDSFGLTTLRTRHVDVDGSQIELRFRGKSRKLHRVTIQDRRLARVIARCTDLPGEVLFQYIGEDGELRPIEAEDVNRYLKVIADEDVTAKDFRTWAATTLAMKALRARPPADSAAAAKRDLVAVVKEVAKRLGNTPAVCRKCYVHPALFQAHLEGRIAGLDVPAADGTLSEDEAAVVALLGARRPHQAAA